MSVEIQEKRCSGKMCNICNDLQDCIRGIQSIEEYVQGKQMLLTFFKREDLLRMSQFLKIIYSIMSDFSEEQTLSPACETEIIN